MKCPYRYRIIQHTLQIINNRDNLEEEKDSRTFIETQDFEECYQENCVCWDKGNKTCRKGN